MPSKLILDPAEPGLAEVVKGAKVGEPLILREVSVVPTIVSETTFEADVGAITVDQAEPPPTETENPPATQMSEAMSRMPKGGGATGNEEGVY